MYREKQTRKEKQTRMHGSYYALGALIVGLLLLAVPAMATSEDTSVDNDDTMLSNAKTELAVKTALLQEIGWKMLPIDVEAHGDHVVLMGTLDDRANQELAKEVALSVKGVEKVTNKLTLEEAETRAPVGKSVANAEKEVKDAVLESRIKTELISSMGLKAFDIEVEATDGSVSLRGELPKKEFAQIALKTAENCDGVNEVINLLTVEKSS